MPHRRGSTHDIIRWLIYALVIGTPLLFSTGFESSFTVPKLTWLRVITLAIVAVWGLQILVQKKLIWRRSALNKWIGAYGATLLISTMASTYFWTSLFGDSFRWLGLVTLWNLLFLIVVGMVFFQERQDIQKFIKVSVGTAVVVAIYGLLQYKGLVGAAGWNHDPTLRVFGTIGHSNHLGAYLAFHVMLLLGLLVNEKRQSWQVGYALALVPMLMTILATASRGAFIALVIAVTVFGVALIHRKWDWVRAQKKRIFGGIVAILLLVGVFHQPLIRTVENLSLTKRTVSTVQFILEGNVPDRVSWWFSSLAMVKDHPLFGHGVATYHDIYNPYRRTDYRVPYDIQDTFTPETAHMEYLDIAATQGVVGLVIYLGLIGTWFLMLWRILRSKQSHLDEKFTALSFLAAGLVYLTQVLMSFGTVSTLVPFYLLIGLSAVLYHRTVDDSSQAKQFQTMNLEGLRLASGVSVVGVLFILCTWFTFRHASAERHLDKALDAWQDGEVAVMLDEYRQTLRQMPWTHAYWVSYGEGTYHFGTLEGANVELVIRDELLRTAINSYERAYQLVETVPHIQANLGITYLAYSEIASAQGESKLASERKATGLAYYEEAVAVGVNNPLFPYNLGIIYESIGENQLAYDNFLAAISIRAPYKDSYYQLAYTATELKDYEAARSYLQKALEEDPSNEAVKTLLQRINSETTGQPTS
jgi:putative inorganic carbon (HCO3(-)) transporter